ncbi:MAG: hypothetical protein U0R49_02305 [Fimbriimonadales bacterium]
MGIERNNRKPKRQRTTSQRMKGRMKTSFVLPEAPAKDAKPKKSSKKAATE